MKLLIEAYGGEIHYELEEDILKTTVELAVKSYQTTYLR